MKRGEQIWCRVTYGMVAKEAGCCVSEVMRLARSGRLDMTDLGSVSRFVVSRTLSPDTERAAVRSSPDIVSGRVDGEVAA